MKAILKHKKMLLIIMFVLLGVAGFLWWKKKKEEDNLSENEETKSLDAGGSPKSKCGEDTPLKKGVRCEMVRHAQREINSIADILEIEPLKEDGVFGAKTEEAFVKLSDKKMLCLGMVRQLVKMKKTLADLVKKQQDYRS